MMNLTDITIIYLTCGAPLGVYYFYQNRDFSKRVWLTSLLVTLFWFAYAFKLLHLIVTKRFLSNEFDEKSLADSFEQKFSQLILEEKLELPIFDFRETFERYSGLTKALSDKFNNNEAELFQITNHENKKLATKILNRRNRLRLETHQILARKDFLRIIEKIYSKVFDQEKLRTLTVDFVKMINDVEALEQLRKIFQESSQVNSKTPVTKVEKEVWNPIEPKPNMRRKALNFRTISAAATTSKAD